MKCTTKLYSKIFFMLVTICFYSKILICEFFWMILWLVTAYFYYLQFFMLFLLKKYAFSKFAFGNCMLLQQTIFCKAQKCRIVQRALFIKFLFFNYPTNKTCSLAFSSVMFKLLKLKNKLICMLCARSLTALDSHKQKHT